MDWWNESFGPACVRYRIGRSRPAAQRGVRSSGSRSSGSRPAENGGIMIANGFGPQSQTGASLAAWGYVFQVGAQSVAVGANINFSNNGPLNGVNHTPGDSAIIVAAAGTYNISLGIYTAQNNPQDWAVVINGTERSRFNAAGQSITSSTSLTLTANDRVTIRNAGTSPDPATLREGETTTAYVLIYKVD